MLKQLQHCYPKANQRFRYVDEDFIESMQITVWFNFMNYRVILSKASRKESLVKSN